MEKKDEKKIDIRKRSLKYGISYPFDYELVMLILGAGIKSVPIQSMAKQIIDSLDSCEQSEVVERLLELKGVGLSKALAIAAAIELGRRRSYHINGVIRKPQDIIPYVRNYAINKKEFFIVVTLNGGHQIIQIHVISIGTVNKTIIHPREIFTEAIKENASAIIICHNHPSGNCEPSSDDIETTQVLMDASDIMGIPILDHIIISSENYYSFVENKIIFQK